MRGTPQQIIDKYQQLARDAQLSGDRVAVEAFFQHSEHYLRMLGAAQKEIDERREQQDRENRERQAERDRERAERDAQRAQRDAEHAQKQPQQVQQPNADAPSGAGEQPDVIEARSDGESALVETPESKPRKPRPPRKPRTPRKPEGEQAVAAPVEQAAPDTTE